MAVFLRNFQQIAEFFIKDMLKKTIALSDKLSAGFYSSFFACSIGLQNFLRLTQVSWSIVF